MRLATVEEERQSMVLEPSPKAGEIPDSVLDELVAGKDRAKNAATDFASAVERVAEKYKVKKGALKRYVTARAGDKLDELREETDSPESLLGLE